MATWIQLDQKIFYLINQVLVHPWLDIFFVTLTDFSKTPAFYLLLPLLLFGIFRRFGWKGLGVLLLAVLLASVADKISSIFIKEFFARPRPEFSSLPETVTLRRPSEGSFSFPSSHALDAFVVASFIFYFRQSWGAWALAVASLIAYSRVYVGLHFPADVLAGAILGTFLGFGGGSMISLLYTKRVSK